MKKILLVILFAFSSFLMAQRVKVISGNYDFLKDQKFIKVVFKYGGLTFTRKKFPNKNISRREWLR
ncbi:hypothetical protein CEQ15_16725 [Chryseobacterium indologenes]|uniref:hypothetical protein n=1 Tax=Chryseobacterium indologenes TaxID=253 RepID=UPI000B517423|nr:hypothetical protein [Chryseobacterium indologenes]ASE63014.1 hypothetical protein CEQ15_16725 [Chryseobacterium indologenes]